MDKQKIYDLAMLDVAKRISELSKDPSSKIGSVITGNDNQIISQGFNGFPRNVADKPERYNEREVKYKFIVHAEANAIYNALKNGASLDGSTIYINGLPCCSECAKAIIQTGIKRVVMRCDLTTEESKRWLVPFEFTKVMLHEADINYEFIDLRGK